MLLRRGNRNIHLAIEDAAYEQGLSADRIIEAIMDKPNTESLEQGLKNLEMLIELVE